VRDIVYFINFNNFGPDWGRDSLVTLHGLMHPFFPAIIAAHAGRPGDEKRRGYVGNGEDSLNLVRCVDGPGGGGGGWFAQRCAADAMTRYAGHLGYVDLDGFLVRTTHGHSIKYNSGVFGLALPASKAIARWDAGRRADLTIFGHYHSWGWLRGARYVANGSVIGHSPYAERVASPERPCQGMAIIDHGRHEVTRAYPLFCDRDLAKKKAAS
jgi:hypothetical protein